MSAHNAAGPAASNCSALGAALAASGSDPWGSCLPSRVLGKTRKGFGTVRTCNDAGAPPPQISGLDRTGCQMVVDTYAASAGCAADLVGQNYVLSYEAALDAIVEQLTAMPGSTGNPASLPDSCASIETLYRDYFGLVPCFNNSGNFNFDSSNSRTIKNFVTKHIKQLPTSVLQAIEEKLVDLTYHSANLPP